MAYKIKRTHENYVCYSILLNVVAPKRAKFLPRKWSVRFENDIPCFNDPFQVEMNLARMDAPE